MKNVLIGILALASLTTFASPNFSAENDLNEVGTVKTVGFECVLKSAGKLENFFIAIAVGLVGQLFEKDLYSRASTEITAVSKIKEQCIDLAVGRLTLRISGDRTPEAPLNVYDNSAENLNTLLKHNMNVCERLMATDMVCEKIEAIETFNE